MGTKKRIGLYLRCSTIEQNLDLQHRELSQYAQARGWQDLHWFEDKGLSGTNDKRPQFQALMKEAKARRIDVILVWKLDRFSRSLRDLVNTLQDLNQIGVSFVSLKDQIDMTSASGRLLVHLLAAFAEFESDCIRLRVNAGLANAKAMGKRLGRPARNDGDRIRALKAKGLSYRAIGRELKCSMGTIRRALQGAPQSHLNSPSDSSKKSEGQDE